MYISIVKKSQKVKISATNKTKLLPNTSHRSISPTYIPDSPKCSECATAHDRFDARAQRLIMTNS